MVNTSDKIYVAGHRGLAGSALVRRLNNQGFHNIVTRTHPELDLTRQDEVEAFFAAERPDHVILAAAKVGGIIANSTLSADFIFENLAIETNVIHSAWENDVDRLIFLGSSCIFPRQSPQPMKEEYLLSGPLEPTNEAYAVAKIAGISMCKFFNRQYNTRFFSLMPTNLYGPNDNFDLTNSHVLPALIRKVHEAKLQGDDHVTIWGTGKPKREFLHVDDFASACVHILTLEENKYDELLRSCDPPLINVGCGKEITIAELAHLVCFIIGFDGNLSFDVDKPDGMELKRLDISRLDRLGWHYGISLRDGIADTYQWCLESGILTAS
ncbi:MAG: GDP-L-fucose synthase [Deltaproteobacteria bacterium]|nr:GDP-L-fucose synthase [Deltaproteobacteria bacterium]